MLDELLAQCGNPHSPQWEMAWKEFISLYKKLIYDRVKASCYDWNVPRLRRQFPEVVNDVVGEVFASLCANGCQALRNFRERGSEVIFRAWLTRICHRAAGRHIRRLFVQEVVDDEVDQDYVRSLPTMERWELFEDCVTRLRQSGPQRGQVDRNISIFLLHVWADFSTSMIRTTPCLRGIGHRVVDLVVNRMRDQLRKTKDQ